MAFSKYTAEHNDFVFVLDNSGRELMVTLDGDFENVLFVDDNDDIIRSMDVDTINDEILAGMFDPGTIETVRTFVGY